MAKPRGSLRIPPALMFLVMLAFLAGGVPAWAQSPPYRVAVLTPGLTFSPVLDGFREGLARLGYQERRDVNLVVEDARGEASGLAERAARLAAAKPHVLFTVATAQTAAAKQTTTAVPIVFAWVGDPIRSGFIAGYSSSENNLTGVSNQAAALSGKRLEILLEAVPGIKRVLAIVAAREDIAQNCFRSLSESASQRGIQLLRRDVTSREEIRRVLRELPRGAMDALVLVPSTLGATHIDLLIQRARVDRIPLGVHEDTMVEQGALLSYGPEFRTIGAQAAKVVVKVLKGARPSELPIQTPEKIVLAINLTTAKTIGLKLPRYLVERADRLVE